MHCDSNNARYRDAPWHQLAPVSALSLLGTPQSANVRATVRVLLVEFAFENADRRQWSRDLAGAAPMQKILAARDSVRRWRPHTAVPRARFIVVAAKRTAAAAHESEAKQSISTSLVRHSPVAPLIFLLGARAIFGGDAR